MPDTVQITFRCDPEVFSALERYRGQYVPVQTRSDVIQRALRRFLEAEGTPPAQPPEPGR